MSTSRQLLLDSIQTLNEAIEQDPLNIRIYYERGIAYERLSRAQIDITQQTSSLEMALVDLNKVVEFIEIEAEATKIAEHLSRQEYLVLRYNVNDLYHVRGNINSNLKKYAEAIEDYNKDLEIHSAKKNYLNIGKAYCLLGEYPKAIDAFTKLIDEYPYVPEYFYNRSIAYLNNNQLDEALKDITTAIEQMNHFPQLVSEISDYYQLLSQIQYVQGNYADAKENFVKAKELYPAQTFPDVCMEATAKKGVRALATQLHSLVTQTPLPPEIWIHILAHTAGVKTVEEAFFLFKKINQELMTDTIRPKEQFALKQLAAAELLNNDEKIKNLKEVEAAYPTQPKSKNVIKRLVSKGNKKQEETKKRMKELIANNSRHEWNVIKGKIWQEFTLFTENQEKRYEERTGNKITKRPALKK